MKFFYRKNKDFRRSHTYDVADGLITDDIKESSNLNLENMYDFDNFLTNYGFRWYQLFIFIISLVTYLADITSDAYLVYVYYDEVGFSFLNYFVYKLVYYLLFLLPSIEKFGQEIY